MYGELNYFFPEGMGVYKTVVEIPKGWGLLSGQKMEIPGRMGGLR